MYIRFVGVDVSADSERALGALHSVFRLRDAGQLYSYEREEVDAITHWFNKNLKRPTRFTTSKPPFYRKQSRAISWLRDNAREHIARMRDLVVILENHGVVVRMLKANRIGYVVYEDEHQALAEPFAPV
jgi:hypothetical protein